ncbi:MAG: YaiI/YqxD family protein [Pseudomonadota bacterium]
MTPRVLVDADACPVKEEVYKVALRHRVPVVLVANQFLRTPDTPLITCQIVSDGFDAADDWIADHAGPTTLVITADIVLADRVLKAGAKALGPNGHAWTEGNIGGALAVRAIKADLRGGGVGEITSGGAKPFTKQDRSRFLQALDTALVALKR